MTKQKTPIERVAESEAQVAESEAQVAEIKARIAAIEKHIATTPICPRCMWKDRAATEIEEFRRTIVAKTANKMASDIGIPAKSRQQFVESTSLILLRLLEQQETLFNAGGTWQ